MRTVIGSLIISTILLCNCVVSDDFLRIELNDRPEEMYNNSADVRLEMDRENTKQPIRKNSGISNHDVLNVIPTDLSERAFQKYYQLRHKLKFRKLVTDDEQVKAVTSVPTSTTTETIAATTTPTTRTTEEVTTTTPLCKKHELDDNEDFSELITDSMSNDYDIIVFVDKEQLEHEPILAPSGAGFFHGIVNFVRWLISLSAEIEVEDYDEE